MKLIKSITGVLCLVILLFSGCSKEEVAGESQAIDNSSEQLISRSVGMEKEMKISGYSAESITVTDVDFEKKVLRESRLVLVFFWADWCGPCRMMSRNLDTAVNSFKSDELLYAKADVDDCLSTCAKYNVSSIPTIIFLKDGKLIHLQCGVIDVSEIQIYIERYL